MKKKRTIVMILLAVVFVVSGGMVIRQQLQYQANDAANAEAAVLAGLPVRSETVKLPEAEAEPAGPELPPGEASFLAELDVESLQQVNSDVIGWILIPGTDLSYPLVQGTDNQYYLTRNWKMESNRGGAVFLEQTNSPDLTDFHTIVYGHRMRNDSMFGMLKYYRDLDYWREHPDVYIAAGGCVYQYTLFSAHNAGLRELVYRLDIEENNMEDDFVQYCMESSAVDTGVVPEEDAQMLTLSTCTGNGHTARWVVHGYLARVYGPFTD